MSNTQTTSSRFFLSYSGVRLPLQLVEELAESALKNRNTWFRADYDAAGRLVRIQKFVYGEVEMLHRYEYADDNRLSQATISMGEDEEQTLIF